MVSPDRTSAGMHWVKGCQTSATKWKLCDNWLSFYAYEEIEQTAQTLKCLVSEIKGSGYRSISFKEDYNNKPVKYNAGQEKSAGPQLTSHENPWRTPSPMSVPERATKSGG